jgi:pimeloyl-ACP methyl ester carboxylesterase/predicted glycosyltransferase
MRARYPDRDGYVERDGVKVFFEAYGDGDPTILLLPTWSIVHSRRWKMQIPYLARHFRVLTFDGRGNGRSDRPRDPAAYADTEFVADALAVMDETGTERAVLAGVSMGGGYALRIAAQHPGRVQGAVFICPAVGLGDPLPARTVFDFEAKLDTEEGWAKQNIHYWRRDWPGYAQFFFEQVFSEPHSTKQIEDSAGWATETDAETILTLEAGPYLRSSAAHRHEGTAGETTRLLAKEVRCPCLVVHGTEDRIVHVSGGRRLAEALGCRFVAFEGSGHCPDARDPVRFNLLMEEFVRDVARPAMAPPAPARATWTRARNRPRRVLYLSSPIGLGHARRDLAIARELRALRPDLEVEWLAQDPVTRVLEGAGERVHPASAWLAGESAHVESEAGEHDLHAFQAIRRMDEILLANFMIAHEAMEDGAFDVVIGDEAWDLDHFLHENPEGKRASFVWMTDFVGWLPMPEGGERERFLTADYNAEMIEHIERYPRVRDRAIFVGNPEDIVNEAFGPGLPPIRAWTEEHYDFAGYVTGFDPAGLDPGAVREELGYLPGERVCVVTVGGSGVGEHLLRKVIAAYPEAKRLVPDLRMVVVAGPRIDPGSLPSHDGLDVRAFVPELYRHLAVCDLAVIQGGLTTAMELVAARRPFVYFPLANHFEQQIHVRHRLERHRAGRPMDYRTSSPEAIADAMAAEIVREPDYLPVETNGAARAAAAIAELL